MEPKKTKLDYFIESYAAYDLHKEAKDVVASHVQYLSASAKLKAAIAKHLQSYMAETFAGIKFQFIDLTPKFPRIYAQNMAKVEPFKAAKFQFIDLTPKFPRSYVKRAHTIPNFSDRVTVLADIKAKKQKTLTARKAKLASEYRNKLASNVASGLVLKVNGILNAFERACANLTFKPARDFYDTLADVRTTLTNYNCGKREIWENFTMPDSHILRSVQSTPILEWLDDCYTAERCFTALAKFEKSSASDKIEEFDQIIHKLETNLCKRLHDDLAGKLVTNANEEPSPNWLDTVDIRHVIRGEYVVADIGSENEPIKMLSSKEELARELSETDLRLSYSLESEECRKGIFASIKAMSKELENGLASAVDKTDFLIGFFNSKRSDYLQAYLDKSIAAAIKGKGSADKSHLNDLNNLLVSYSVIASPNNGESRVVGVLGASELVHYVKFVCPWLTYKANDGGWVESTKWEGLATAHKGDGFPVIGKDDVCLYPPISLIRYLTVKKTVQAQVRITNRARKRHNENLAKQGK